ncbi:hypothetical protein GRI39_04860 [Altererythrobacter indicus]|uniref:Uncharacterized protein n=1 Tax=Altericroceibacterium indicum TaxID=374177 RepID=A0A845A761_9SPHN|nr:hypothetical protein [Altericroceibacterium indicum]MXP25377.1 hypothetical protein [Altericroceibacterium indicum]
MSSEFIGLHLFKPFHSLKLGSRLDVGIFEADSLLKAMDGNLNPGFFESPAALNDLLKQYDLQY